MRAASYAFCTQNLDPLSKARELATNLLDPCYRPQDVITGKHLYTRHCPSEFRDWIGKYLTPAKCRVMLAAYFDDDWDLLGQCIDNAWSTAPWFGTRYKVERFSDVSVPVCPDVGDESFGLSLPTPNPYISKQLPTFSEHVALPVRRVSLLLRLAS